MCIFHSLCYTFSIFPFCLVYQITPALARARTPASVCACERCSDRYFFEHNSVQGKCTSIYIIDTYMYSLKYSMRGSMSMSVCVCVCVVSFPDLFFLIFFRSRFRSHLLSFLLFRNLHRSVPTFCA